MGGGGEVALRGGGGGGGNRRRWIDFSRLKRLPLSLTECQSKHDFGWESSPVQF